MRLVLAVVLAALAFVLGYFVRQPVVVVRPAAPPACKENAPVPLTEVHPAPAAAPPAPVVLQSAPEPAPEPASRTARTIDPESVVSVVQQMELRGEFEEVPQGGDYTTPLPEEEHLVFYQGSDTVERRFILTRREHPELFP
jgi:hypothetical protein